MKDALLADPAGRPPFDEIDRRSAPGLPLLIASREREGEAPRPFPSTRSLTRPLQLLQGCLAHQKHPPPRTLQQDYT